MARLSLTRLAYLSLLCSFVYSSQDGEFVTVVVDLDEGDDDLCMSAIEMVKTGINSYATPCASLNFAVRGNVSLGNVSIDECNDATSILKNVRIILRSGVHQLTERLVLGSSKNITFQADDGADPIVRCVSYPNYEPGNYDNIFGCRVDGLHFKGITFEECGPIPSNVFIYGGSSVSVDSCIFR